jgi:hypothetical protein
MQAIVDEVSRLYRTENETVGTHLALRWKGRVRYTVPRELAGQAACWGVFMPGKLGIALRAMARLPRLFGTVDCVESERLVSVREAIGDVTGLSCCRAGAEGVWSKDTILFLSIDTSEPLYIAKAGAGEAVDALLRNEANWLRTLGEQPFLAEHIPGFIAHRSGSDLSFVVQSAIAGSLDFSLGDWHFEFLRKLHKFSIQVKVYEDSQLYLALETRVKELCGQLTEAWSTRLEKAMQRITESLSGSPVALVTAHNDFTPWNIRVRQNRAHVFDWEYAASERLPLFDPLHFVLMPMALRSPPTKRLLQSMRHTLKLCKSQLAAELCYEPDTQALAYMTNICTLYLWGDPEGSVLHPSLACYAQAIDYLCSN